MPFDGTELPPLARVLIDARSFMERGWCKNHQAMTAADRPTAGRDPAAVRWCLVGSLFAATVGDDELLWTEAMHAVGKFVPDGVFGLASFNNTQDTVAPVLDVIDRAIAEVIHGR